MSHHDDDRRWLEGANSPGSAHRAKPPGQCRMKGFEMANNPGTTSIENPQSLRDAGGWAVQISGRIRATGGHPKKDTENASNSFSGSKWEGELGGALRTLADHWENKSRKLAADCKSLGESCTRTADNYVKTENENSDSQSAIHQQIKSDFG